MSKIKPQTLKGFRDFLPKEVRKRQYLINTLKKVFESYGFEPLETPALEYEEILAGKYGEEGEKLMYRFNDLGGRKVAMRYDQTVPLARVVAQYQNDLPVPFKRYQIQNVWRGENPQKGRFREFLQCDADIVGSSSPFSDAEIIALTTKSLEKLGILKFKIFINDRTIFKDITPDAVIIIDKLKKIGKETVLDELVKKNLAKDIDEATVMFRKIEESSPSKTLKKTLSYLPILGIDPLKCEFSPTLARGLNYYTGMIFEVEVKGYNGGSVAGGGRYDNLIGLFANKQIPAVGFSFGFDRLIEAMEELNLFPNDLATTKVLITVFSPEFLDKSIEVTSQLRTNNINAELYLDDNTPLDKQLKYADNKGIPYAIIIGTNEIKKKSVTLKNMQTRQQEILTSEEVIEKIRQ